MRHLHLPTSNTLPTKNMIAKVEPAVPSEDTQKGGPLYPDYLRRLMPLAC